MVEPPADRFKANYTEILTVTVQAYPEPAKTYFLHTSQATKTSKFFRDKAGGDVPIYLSLDIPNMFDTYVEWAYYGKLVIHEDFEQQHDSYDDLVRLYNLGIDLKDKAFCNAIMDATIERGSSHGWVTAYDPDRYLREDLIGCMIQLFVRVYAVLAKPGDRPSFEEGFAGYLLHEYQLMVHDMTRFRLPTMADRCDYHDHDEGEPRCN
ncbi:hypothetical protein BDY17DRAFT_150250 [Neohortaea acidophila]|uniref:BTB domain-containing protein n=1 Tax=Neohortaea acidophila TaxID=245834 RepID=A0A6A6PVR6_9PEZI|nr:uncharacterized protein BDY17DRAFT_150250 [Neohortaea acidophila]KAF2483573.1 hypothetical protein BDY17DRAFT_150250 [Neohortaea acidophila]